MVNPVINQTNIVAPRVPLVDERTGLISREWYRFFLNLFVLTGSGQNDVSLLDLQVGPPTQPLIDVDSLNPEPNGFAAYAAGSTQESQIAELQKHIQALVLTTQSVDLSEVWKQLQALQVVPPSQLDALTTGAAILYGNGSGGFSNVIIGSGVSFTSGTLSATSTGTGDVVGPASSTDNAIARFNLTTGKLLQNSVIIVGDTGNITGVNALTAESLVVNNNATLGSSNTDTLDVRARIISDLEPNVNNAKDIGTSGRNWRDGFFGRNLNTVNLSVTGTTSFDGSQGTSGQVLTSAGTGNTPTWTTPTTGTITAVTATAPVASSGGTTPVISMAAASASANGYLTSTDWNTFNGKQPAGTYVTSVSGTSGRVTSTGGTTPAIDLASGIATAGTTGSASLIPVVTVDTYGRVTSITTAANPQGTVTSVTGTSPVASTGGATPAVSLSAAYGDTLNPYGSKTANFVLAAPNGLAGVPTFRAIVAADIPTLNQNTTGSATTLAIGRTIAITGDLAYTSPSFNGSSNVTASGTLATVNANVGAFTYANITVNAKGLVTSASNGTSPVTSVTGTSPVISSGGATPAISIPAATASVNGYLTSTDWNTFNNKTSNLGTVTSVAAITLGTTGTDLSSTVANGTTTPVITLQVPTASASNRGALSSADWSTFNSKQPAGTYVAAISIVSANGLAGTSSGGATPALTLSTSINGVAKGNGTALSAATAGTDYSVGTSSLATGILKSTTTTGALSIAVAADFPTLNQNTTGTAANVTGIVAIANGGSGTATPALVAGSNVTITGSWPNQTINSTASGGGGGTVTSVSVVSANGFTGTVATATTTPAITLTTSITGLLKGNGTAISAAVANVDYVGVYAPVVKTADFTVVDNDLWLINNKSGSTCTVTLPTASAWVGRTLTFKTLQAQAVVSNSSNVTPITGTTAGTSILESYVGNWATMVSDGTSWVVMASRYNIV
jgi:hypothetical protein